MLYLVESLVALYLAYFTYRIFKQGLAMNVIAIPIFIAAVAMALAAFHLSQWIARGVASNVLTRAAVPLLMTNVGYFATYILLSRKFKRDNSPGVVALKKKLVMPRWADRSLCAGFVVVLCAVMFVLATLLVTILSVEESWRTALTNRTMVLWAFVPDSRLNTASAVRSADGGLEETMGAQERLKRGIAGIWSSARDAVADGTGLSGVQDQLEALQEILNLSTDESSWLVEKNPNLKHLLNHPRLMAIVENQHILDLIQRVGNGDIGAVYVLGDEPDIKALAEDKDFVETVRSIDLLELHAQLIDTRKNRAAMVPIIWDTNAIQNTLQLDACLRSKAGWRTLPKGAATLTYGSTTPIGLARTAIIVEQKPQHKLQFRLRSAGRISVLVNNQPIKLAQDGEELTFKHAFEQGVTRIDIMVEFISVTGPRICSVQAFIAK
jgi:hypothetical protein